MGRVSVELSNEQENYIDKLKEVFGVKTRSAVVRQIFNIYKKENPEAEVQNG